MYASQADQDAGLLVAVYSGAGPTLEADQQRALDDFVSGDRAAVQRGCDYVVILVIGQGVEAPPAQWRKRFADATSELSASNVYIAYATENVLIRGALTALTWLVRARPGTHRFTCASFEEACEWVRGATSRRHPQLEALYAAARDQLIRAPAPRAR